MLVALPVMIGVSLVVFVFMRLIPGDPVDIMLGEASVVGQEELARLRAEWGLDQPLGVQLYNYFSRLVRGDLGKSLSRPEDVIKLILSTMPATIELTLCAMCFALFVGIPVGVFCAVKHNSLYDRLGAGGTLLGVSIPAFCLGIMLILVFAVWLGILPSTGRLGPGAAYREITGFLLVDSVLARDWGMLGDALKHLLLPSVALGAAPCAVIARVTRAGMLETLRKDYVVFARAKGVPESRILWRHALRNAIIPSVAVIGLETGTLLGGNMIVETVFGWPGMGRLVVDAIFARDYPLVQGAVMVYAFTFVLMNVLTDVVHSILDPRASFEM